MVFLKKKRGEEMGKIVDIIRKYSNETPNTLGDRWMTIGAVDEIETKILQEIKKKENKMKKEKCCWLAQEYRKGWKLGFCIENDKPLWLRNVLFVSEKEVKKALRRNIVFVHLKG